MSEATIEHDLSVVSVLSGNRNFEGRIHPDVKQNYLASPPLVVAFALAGTVDIDLTHEPLGVGKDGEPVFLADLWPSDVEVSDAVRASVTPQMFSERYASVFDGDERWRAVPTTQELTYDWDPASTYVKLPAVLRRSLVGARYRGRRRRCARARQTRRLGHHGSHLTGRQYSRVSARRSVPHRRRRQARRLQQLRHAAR